MSIGRIQFAVVVIPNNVSEPEFELQIDEYGPTSSACEISIRFLDMTSVLTPRAGHSLDLEQRVAALHLERNDIHRAAARIAEDVACSGLMFHQSVAPLKCMEGSKAGQLVAYLYEAVVFGSQLTGYEMRRGFWLVDQDYSLQRWKGGLVEASISESFEGRIFGLIRPTLSSIISRPQAYLALNVDLQLTTGTVMTISTGVFVVTSFETLMLSSLQAHSLILVK